MHVHTHTKGDFLLITPLCALLHPSHLLQLSESSSIPFIAAVRVLLYPIYCSCQSPPLSHLLQLSGSSSIPFIAAVRVLLYSIYCSCQSPPLSHLLQLSGSSSIPFIAAVRVLLYSIYCSCQGPPLSLLLQLSGSSSIAADRDEWQHVVSDVRKTVTELETLRDTCISLRGGSDGVEGQVELLQPDVVECARKIQPLVKETVELDHLKCYLEWMVAIHHLRCGVATKW